MEPAGAPFGQTDFCRYDGEVLGAMAQLVARLVRNEKVGGSNPPSSTTWVGLIARPFVYPRHLQLLYQHFVYLI